MYGDLIWLGPLSAPERVKLTVLPGPSTNEKGLEVKQKRKPKKKKKRKEKEHTIFNRPRKDL